MRREKEDDEREGRDEPVGIGSGVGLMRCEAEGRWIVSECKDAMVPRLKSGERRDVCLSADGDRRTIDSNPGPVCFTSKFSS